MDFSFAIPETFEIAILRTFHAALDSKLDDLLYRKLWRWAQRRHPKQGKGDAYRRYWQCHQGRMRFSDGLLTLVHYSDTPIRRHIKVRGTKSPFDGDWPYWATRLGRDPLRPQRITTLLKRQRGKCHHCGQWFRQTDLMEVHHADGDRSNNRYQNLRLLHRHCHDQLHRQQRQTAGDSTCDVPYP